MAGRSGGSRFTTGYSGSGGYSGGYGGFTSHTGGYGSSSYGHSHGYGSGGYGSSSGGYHGYVGGGHSSYSGTSQVNRPNLTLCLAVKLSTPPSFHTVLYVTECYSESSGQVPAYSSHSTLVSHFMLVLRCIYVYVCAKS